MSNQPNPQDILNSIGAISEMLDVFHSQLISRGFDRGGCSVSNRRILENYH